MSSGPFCFHLSEGGNPTGIGDMYDEINAVGRVPYGMVANDLGRAGEVLDHGGECAFRWTGPEFEFLDYALSPQDAANKHMSIIIDRIALAGDFRPELWLVSVNEPDKARSAWIGQTCFHVGELMLEHGLKWLAPAWSGGEPRRDGWDGWQNYLRLCAQHPDKLGVAVHEYTFNILTPIQFATPHLIGRFRWLHDFCDAQGIARPTIWITEWGWEYEDVPEPLAALADIEWAYANIYAQHENVKVICIWYLGSGFANIANKAVKIMPELQNWLVNRELLEPVQTPPPVEPPVLGPMTYSRAGHLHIRSAPGLENPIVAHIGAGTEFTPTDKRYVGKDIWVKWAAGMWLAERYNGITFLEPVVELDLSNDE